METNFQKIIHVVSYFPPHLGGMENCVLEIAKQQAEDNYNVQVITSDVGYSTKYKKPEGLSVEYLKSLEFAHTPLMFSLFFKLLLQPKKSIMHLHISQAYTPEIVYLISKIRKIPYVAHVHLDVDASGRFGFLLSPYKKYILSCVLKSAAKIICLADYQKKFTAKKYDLPLSQIVVIPNGVSKQFFVKKSIVNKIPRLVFVGRLAKQKNLHVLINAISLMNTKIHLDIVGGGEEENSLKKVIQKNKLKNVKLLGKKTGEDLINIYKTSDVFVIASEKEGFSLAILEAMAAGLPVVGADVTGIRELIRNCGILVSNPSPKSFAFALDKLLSNKEDLEKLSTKSVNNAKNYSWDKITAKIENIYEEVLV